MYDTLKPVLEKELQEIKAAGLYKQERIITSPQAADIRANGRDVIN
ncbi:MAG: glycine C-acetyltransferase, partial [Bacteroidota bacterium]